jgi:RecA/RadA recombinase
MKKSDVVDQVDYLGILKEVEKVAKIQAVTPGDEARISTGLLTLDLILGGGVTAGMYTFMGPEQSAKTTAAIWISASSIDQDVGFRALWDAENSTGSSTDYVANILRTVGKKDVTIAELFGQRKNGKFVKKPLIYYQDIGEGEAFFNWFAAFLRRLPDKRYEDDRWWLIFDDTKENRAHIAKTGQKIDLNMSKQSGGRDLYVPAENGALQALIVVDSYPALVPSALDDDDPSAALAISARMFSQHLPRVKGKLRRKRVALIGINQLGTNPMARFSNPEYEKGGGALKFNSDVRIRWFPRVATAVDSPYAASGGKGQIETEPSVTSEGNDVYRFVHGSAIKNKLSLPGRKGWFRIWVSDAKGRARGFDPVFDTFYVLGETGQLTCNAGRKNIKLNIRGLGEAKKPIDWLEFKTLIVGLKEDKLKVFQKIGYKPVDIRRGILNQLRKGTLEEMYVDRESNRLEAKRAKEAEKNDDD